MRSNCLEEIRDISISDVLNRLGIGLKRVSRGILQGDCITGHVSSGHKCFTVYEDSNRFYCFSCNIAGSNIDLVMHVLNYDTKEAIEWLIKEFKPDLMQEWNKKPIGYDTNKERAFVRASLLYEAVYELGKGLILTERAKEERGYLYSRGYTDETIKASQWIYYPPESEIREHLKNKFNIVPDDLKLQGHLGDVIRLALPYRDRRKQITGFYKRAIRPLNTTENKDYTAGLDKSDLYRLYACRGKDTVIVVEGLPDAELLGVMGIDNVVALGQATLSNKHIEGLKDFKIKKVILALDNDLAGIEGTIKAINLLKKEGFITFVIDPYLYGEHKDPDEFVRYRGIEAFKSVLSSPEMVGCWIVKQAFRECDLANKSQVETTIHNVLEVGVSLDALNQNELISSITEITGYDADILTDIRDKYSKEETQRQFIEQQINALNEAKSLLLSNEKKDYIALIKDLSSKINIEGIKETIFKTNIYEEVSKVKSELMTGYKELEEKNIMIPSGAITIIGGRPSHGKTTLLLNLCLRMIKRYPDKSFIFFSYEEEISKLFLKMIMILACELIHADKRLNKGDYDYQYRLCSLNNVQWYIKRKENNNPFLNNAIETLQGYLDTGRLKLSDAHLEVNKLADMIMQQDNTGAIFIDYIQRIKGHEDTSYSNQVRIQRVSNEILGVAIETGLPIIMGAQVSREYDSKIKKEKDDTLPELHHLRESGDIEQDANLVLTIHRDISNPTGNIKIGVKKNREGRAGDIVELRFIGCMYTIL